MKTLKFKFAHEGFLCEQHPTAPAGYSYGDTVATYVVNEVPDDVPSRLAMGRLLESLLLRRGRGGFEFTYAELAAAAEQSPRRASNSVSNSNPLQKTAQPGLLS